MRSTKEERDERSRADRVSAWMVGVGNGLIALMVMWLVGNRIATLIWDPPVGPIVAISGAILAGVAVSLVIGIRLERPSRAERSFSSPRT